jgi:hypothetical protein
LVAFEAFSQSLATGSLEIVTFQRQYQQGPSAKGWYQQ